MFEPLLIRTPLRQLTRRSRRSSWTRRSLEKFGMEAAKADDQRVVEVYTKAGDKVVDMDAAAFAKWREVARASAWKDFEEKVKNGKQLMDMAASVK